MAQWDVYINPSLRARAELPFLVDVQSDLLSGLSTRLVVPFAVQGTAPNGLPRRLCPEFEIESQRVQLVAHEAGSVETAMLRQRVASLREQSHRIIDAIDTVISGV